MTKLGTIQPDVKIASSLASRVSLLDISCVALSAKVTSAPTPGVLAYDLKKVVATWHISGLDMVATLPFRLTVHGGKGDDSTDLASFSVIMRAEYRINGTEFQPEHLPHYVGIMGYMHTWPYFRADIQYMTTKVGFPALVLPVVVSGEVPRRIRVLSMPLSEEDAEPVTDSRKKVGRAAKGSKLSRRPE